MRKIFQRFMGIMLSVTLLFAVGSASVYAMDTRENISADNAVSVTNVERVGENKVATTYEFDLSKCEVDEDGYSILPLTSNVTSSFTMSGTYHRGGDRVYQGNYLTYEATAIGSDGKAYSQTVTLQLWDYNHPYALHENNIVANGITNKVKNLSIRDNRTYYFKYYSSGERSLKVSMVIYSTY